MALDPLIFQNAVSVYQNGIDSIINNLGKNVTLYFLSTYTGVTTDYEDIIRPGDIKKPKYKTTNSNQTPIITTNTKVIKALIKDNPKEFLEFGIRVSEGKTITRLKGFFTDIPSLQQCDYIVPHSDNSPYQGLKFRLIMAPIIKGLGIDRYFVSYWISS